MRARFLPSGLPAATWWIVVITGAHLIAGLLAVVPWLATGEERLLRSFFDYPGAVLLFALPCAELCFCWLALRAFSAGEPLRPAWMLITLAAMCHATGAMLAHILSMPSLVNPLMWAGAGDATLLHQIRRCGLAIAGPIEMALAGSGLFLALRVYRRSGMWARLKARDWALIAVVSVFAVYQLYQVGVAVRLGKQMGLYDLMDLANDPMLCVLALEAILLRRSVVSMGRGLIARCWGAFATAIFFTCLGDMGLWATNYGYLPWPYAAVTWYVWFPAAAAYAIAPAYQVAAERRATAPARSRFDGGLIGGFPGSRLGGAPAA